MNSKKNVGRKRLGRIQIAGGGQTITENGHQINRPFQLQSKSVAGGKEQDDTNTAGRIQDDLSFSTSFACDLDNDLDLMSALENAEKEYRKPKQMEHGVLESRNNGTGANKTVKTKQTPNKVDSTKPGIVREVRETDSDGFATPTVQKVARKRKVSRNSVVSLNTSATMFDNFTWDSPIQVSTPLETKSARNLRSKTSSGNVNTNVNTSTNKENKPKKRTPKRVSPKETPKRPTLSSTSATKQEESSKPSTDSLNHEVGNKKSSNEFFQSLMLENDSLELSTDQNSIHQPSTSKASSHDKQLNSHKEKPYFGESSKKEVVKSKDSLMDKAQPIAAGRSDVDQTRKDTGKSKARERSSDSNAEVHTEKSDGGLEKETKKSPSAAASSSSGAVEMNVEDNSALDSTAKSVDGLGAVIKSDQLSLSSWGLPEPVLKQYTQRGITHMFEWQAECLLTGNVLGGGNLVYSAPTSAGKTMVAELLVLKRVMETRKKAIIILPFVSVTREKMFYLQELYQDAGIRVSGFMGHYAPAGGFSSVDVAVCTIEKGNGLINRLLEENKLDKLGIIVVDELHLLGDPHRGYLLELLLTKISYMTKKFVNNKQGETEAENPIQIVGMSATLPNLDLLANWLNADLYRTDYRPVPLMECMKIGTAVYNNNMEIIRDVDVKYKVKGDTEHVIPLCIETLKDGHSILIFCPTKNWCEKLSETIAREFYNLLKNPEIATTTQPAESSAQSDVLVLPLNRSTLQDIVEQLRRTPVGVDQILGLTVPYGVAYHHAGLTFDERDIVEGAFRQGILKVLVATSTLSSGVNLPARRVLIRTPVFHGGKVIDFLTYKQMIGRAGRKGVDTAGESILLCKPNEKSKAMELVTGQLPPVKSTLIKNEGEELSSSMKRAILEVVVSGVAMEAKDVASYASCTLLAASLPADSGQTKTLIEQCIGFLQENEFVCKQTVNNEDGSKTERFIPTQLGAAVLASSLSPDEGLAVFSELQRARQCFVLENELHIIYQVTPIYSGIGDYIDWYQFFCIWESLPTGMRKVAEMIGVQESYLAKSVRGRVPVKTAAQQISYAIHKRFYTALVLHDLVQEVPLSAVAKKYNCNKGQLQSLQQSAATFAGMVTVFCARLGWSNLELILSQFQNRLTFGVQRELCDLVRISTLNGQRARVLYNGGYQTVAALASANPADIEALLKNSAPFQSTKRQGTETKWEAEERRKSCCIFLTGRKGVTEYEAAVIIIDEAKAMIQDELGGLGIQWNEGRNKPDLNVSFTKRQVTETEWEAEERRKSRCIFLTGRKGVTEYEAAVIIIDEAKAMIQDELGGLGIQWNEGRNKPDLNVSFTKRQGTETEWEAEERRKSRCIFLTGRKGVTEYEAAVIIIDEAKAMIQDELGGLGIQWNEGRNKPDLNVSFTKRKGTETEWEAEERRKSRCIFLTGRKGVTEYEAAVIIIDEAKAMIQDELGGLGIQWNEGRNKPDLNVSFTKRQGTETEWEAEERCKSRCIFLTGRKGVTEYEAAVIIIDEAKAMIQDELGGLGIQWNDRRNKPDLNVSFTKRQGTETEWEAEERRKSRCIFLTGRKGVTEYEAAVIIIDEAKAMIQDELGGLGIQWNDGRNKPDFNVSFTKRQGAETEWEAEERRKSRCIFLTGRKGVTEYEAAVIIIDEAKAMIQDELGGLGIQWNDGRNKPDLNVSKSPVVTSPIPTQQRRRLSSRKSLNRKRKSHDTSGRSSLGEQVNKASPTPPKRKVLNPAEPTTSKPILNLVVSPPTLTNVKQTRVATDNTTTGKDEIPKGPTGKLPLESPVSENVMADTSRMKKSEVIEDKKEELLETLEIITGENDRNKSCAIDANTPIVASEVKVTDKHIVWTDESKETNITLCDDHKTSDKISNDASKRQPNALTVSHTKTNGNAHVRKDVKQISDVQKDTVTPKNSTNPKGNDAIDDEFLDTFVLDTQTANSIICNLHKNSLTDKSSPVNSDVNTNSKAIPEEVVNSEALFSENIDDDCQVENVDDNSGINNDNKQNVVEDLHDSFEEELHLKLSESQDSNKSDDDLERNIFQASSEEIFNNSDEMIAASNYERVGLTGETSVNVDRLNSSYEDLHIPYQSGQEVCFEHADKGGQANYQQNANMFTANVTTNNSKCDNRIGLFSSPEPVKVQINAQVESDHSFSSTFNVSDINMEALNSHDKPIEKGCVEISPDTHKEQTNNDQNSKVTKRIFPKAKVSPKDKEQFGDSLTMSMIDQVFDGSNSDKTESSDELVCNKMTNVAQASTSKQSCDNVVFTNEMTSDNDKVVRHEKQNASNKVQEKSKGGSNEFATPKGRAVKRSSLTPINRNCKISKKSDSNYSTPNAQRQDKMRTNKESSKDQQKTASDGVNAKGSLKTNNAATPNNDGVNESPSTHNTSTGSDCVPPTPPETDQSGSTITPKRTPLRSLNTIGFSPRLKSTMKNGTTKSDDKQTMSTSVRGGKSEQTASSNSLRGKEQDEQNVVKEIKVQKGKGKRKADVKENNVNRRDVMEFQENLESETNDMDTGADLNEEDGEDKFSPSFIDPEESGITLTQASFTIIDVCADKRLFKTFIMEWRTKARYAVSVACEKRLQQQASGCGIGAKYRKDATPSKSDSQTDGIIIEGSGLVVVGVAVSWDNRDAYYVSFTHSQTQGDLNESLAAPPSDKDISVGIRIKAVKSVLQQAMCKDDKVTIVMFDVKAQYRCLAEGCGFVPKGLFEDPKVACWMLDPGARERTLHGMVTNLLPSEVHLLHGLGGGIGVGSLGLSPENPGTGRYRATTECVLVRHLAEYFRACLSKEGLLDVYSEVEMPAAISLCRMELNGFGFSEEESESQKSVMIAKLSALEEQAYSLAGHPFSLSATEDISQILYFEFQLPPNGDPTSMPVKSLAPRGVGARRAKPKAQYSTSKDILEKLKKLHPLPGVILEWRRITNALTKVVFPLQKEKIPCDYLSMYRIYSECQLHSATGRVSLSELNLQNVPKDFEIVMPGQSMNKIPCDYLSMYRIYSECQLHSATGRVSLSEPNLQNVPKDFEIVMPGKSMFCLP